MTLKTAAITITEGRDAGKTFRITEWPCMRSERWILRAVFGLGKAGVEIPPEVFKLGAAPMAYVIASQATKIPSRLGLQLADELMECVQRVERTADRSLVDQDIEDFTTRLRLKAEVLKVLFGFFVDAASPSSPEPGASGAEPQRR